MGYSRQCQFCGAFLDPAEICDCLESRVITAYRNAAPEIKRQVDALVDKIEKGASDAANI